MERARLALRQPRLLRFNLIRTYAGTRYSEEGADKVQPLNMLSVYVDVVLRQIAPAAPRVMLSSFNREVGATLAYEQRWINDEIVKEELAAMFERAVLDGLFGVGIVKVGIAGPADAAKAGWDVKAGDPYAKLVDFDDFVVDMHARSWDEIAYVGHRVRLPLEVVQEDKSYRRVRKDLTASVDAIYNQQGDPRVSVIGRTIYQSQEQEFLDMVDLWEVYIPSRNEIVTFRAAENGQAMLAEDGEPLRVQRWIGPQTGPYHILRFGTVPGNLLPKAPLQDLIDQHEFINHLYRKIIWQAQNQKTVIFVAGSADADGKRTIEASDLDVIRVDNPERIREVPFGGPNQQIFGVFVDALNRFNMIAGNIESSGGLGPMAKTARQDKLLQEAASGMILFKQERATEFINDVLTTMVWFYHHHPTKVMHTQFNLPGIPDFPGVPVTVTPDDRHQVGWDDMNVQVDLYTVNRQTPQSRANDLLQLVMQVITPLMPALKAQGLDFNVAAFLQKIAIYKNMPDLPELVRMGAIPDPGGGAQQEQGEMGQPRQGQTTEHVRTNMPGRTQAATDMNMAAQLMTGNDQGGAPEGNGALNGAGR
jgi:hypothetical protein